ncbi:26240_t:CDS:2, partial [Racocetra persica]
ESKLYVQYQNQVAEILISYDGDQPLIEVEENEDNGTFEEFEYENEVLDEAEGFYVSEELPSNEPDLEGEPLELKLEKSVDETHLTWKQKRKAKNFLNIKKAIFARDTNDLGQTNLMVYEIDTGSATPIKQTPYRAAPA